MMASMTVLSAANLSGSDARLPMHQRISLLVEQAIEDGGLKPGDPLPPESRIARDCSVALGTVRQAMENLRERGLIERRQGRGTFVRQPDFAESMLRFFRFGDGVSTRLPAGEVLEIRTADADAATASALLLDTDAPVVTMKRVRSIEGRRLVWERIWLPRPLFDGVADVDPQQVPHLLYPWYMDAFGVLVSRAREDLTIDRATAEDADLLGCEPGEPIVVIERLATTLTGGRVERRISRGLASTFHYRIEIS